jgi:type II secretory ATPase GspE/PulE/Tfp pilus assembly ATPase PilB-like protein
MTTPPAITILEPSDSEDSAPQILERLAAQAETAGASDIHLQMAQGAAAVSFRLDGVMTPAATLPAGIAERVFGRIKFLARLKTYQESLPQDGRIDRADLKTRCDIRVATYPTVTGEKIVLRLFDSQTVKPLAELDFPAPARAELERFLAQTAGMLLLTGPAGSGKTTTIYACLRELAQMGGRHIITIEDPAEQIVPGIMQTEVNEARGLDYAKAARHLLRQDPQVLVIGEIRDEETAQLAIRAALTGHLLICTLHAGSCKGVFERLLSMSTDATAMASSIELVLNQRLLRRICKSCSGVGCHACLGSGYQGRLLAIEWLRVTDILRRQIAARSLDAIAPSTTLTDSAHALVQAKLTTEAEVRRVLGGTGN